MIFPSDYSYPDEQILARFLVAKHEETMSQTAAKTTTMMTTDSQQLTNNNQQSTTQKTTNTNDNNATKNSNKKNNSQTPGRKNIRASEAKALPPANRVLPLPAEPTWSAGQFRKARDLSGRLWAWRCVNLEVVGFTLQTELPTWCTTWSI